MLGRQTTNLGAVDWTFAAQHLRGLRGAWDGPAPATNGLASYRLYVASLGPGLRRIFFRIEHEGPRRHHPIQTRGDICLKIQIVLLAAACLSSGLVF